MLYSAAAKGRSPERGSFPRSLCLATLKRRWDCLLYTSDAADERSSVDLGGRRIIKKKNRATLIRERSTTIEGGIDYEEQYKEKDELSRSETSSG